MAFRFAFVVLFGALALGGAPRQLKDLQTGDHLARFVYRMSRAKVPPAELLKGLESKDKLRLDRAEEVIPVREIFGAAVEARFRRELGEGFLGFGRRHEVRTYCAFRGKKGTVYRYAVVILDDGELESMKQLLARVAAQCPLHRVAMARQEVPFLFGKPKTDPAYSEARDKTFPHAREACAFAGCEVVWKGKGKAKVLVCPKCDEARRAWLAGHPVEDARVR